MTSRARVVTDRRYQIMGKQESDGEGEDKMSTLHKQFIWIVGHHALSLSVLTSGVRLLRWELACNSISPVAASN